MRANESGQKDNSAAIRRNSAFVWVAAATAVILLVPAVATTVSDEVNWDAQDFLVAGVLLLATGSAFVWLARRSPPRRWAAIALGLGLIFLYVYAELAVGILTDAGK